MRYPKSPIFLTTPVHTTIHTRAGNKVLAFFDVLSWGYGAYINLMVKAPSGHEIQKFDAESEGRVEFVASEDGEHSFCFSNAHTDTELSFWVNTETDSALSDVAKEGMSFMYNHSHFSLSLSHSSIVSSSCVLLTVCIAHRLSCRITVLCHTEHVSDMVYSVEKLNSLVSAARVDLEAFKAREHHHRRSTSFDTLAPYSIRVNALCLYLLFVLTNYISNLLVG